LAKKLQALSKWIADKKDGLLMSKPYVLDLLLEVITDAETWLCLSALSTDERLLLYTSENFSIVEQYWLEVLFPRWIETPDPKFPTWRREVMNGNFKREDEPILGNLAQELQHQGGTFLWRHVLDLSMATDLLASGQQKKVLCVQLTTVSGQYLTKKQEDWKAALQHWQIERGLLVSYSPMEDSLVLRLVKIITSTSDLSTTISYDVKEL
jgi:hypothetical protein